VHECMMYVDDVVFGGVRRSIRQRTSAYVRILDD
jgi:hypothetical protein